MDAAWIAATVAQAVLAAALWRSGDRGWWTWCLIVATAKTAILASVSSGQYWLAWTVLEPASIGLRLLAVYEAVDRYAGQFAKSDRTRVWIRGGGGLVAAMIALASLLAPSDAVLYRRASRILYEIGSAACLAPLLVTHAVAKLLKVPARHGWLTAYFSIQTAAAGAHLIGGPGLDRAFNDARLWLVGGLFGYWAALLTREAGGQRVFRETGKREDSRDGGQTQ